MARAEQEQGRGLNLREKAFWAAEVLVGALATWTALVALDRLGQKEVGQAAEYGTNAAVYSIIAGAIFAADKLLVNRGPKNPPSS